MQSIVVADSSKTVRRMVEISLSRHPFTLENAETADAATLAAKGKALAIIDAGLPGDGYAAAKAIGSAGTKVVLLVGRNSRYDADKGGDAGVVSHITKPFQTQELVKTVFEALGQEVPDADIFKSGLGAIPLARKPKAAPEPPKKAAPPAPRKGPPPPPPPPPAAKAAPPAAPAKAPTPAPPAAPPAPAASAEEPAAQANPFDGVKAPFDEKAETKQFDKAAPEAAPAAAAAVAAVTGSLSDALSAASKETIERIAWEVIPPLAEAILKEEIARVVRERMAQ